MPPCSPPRSRTSRCSPLMTNCTDLDIPHVAMLPTFCPFSPIDRISRGSHNHSFLNAYFTKSTTNRIPPCPTPRSRTSRCSPLVTNCTNLDIPHVAMLHTFRQFSSSGRKSSGGHTFLKWTFPKIYEQLNAAMLPTPV